MGRVSGGLDELNSILSITQKKINRFKVWGFHSAVDEGSSVMGCYAFLTGKL